MWWSDFGGKWWFYTMWTSAYRSKALDLVFRMVALWQRPMTMSCAERAPKMRRCGESASIGLWLYGDFRYRLTAELQMYQYLPKIDGFFIAPFLSWPFPPRNQIITSLVLQSYLLKRATFLFGLLVTTVRCVCGFVGSRTHRLEPPTTLWAELERIILNDFNECNPYRDNHSWDKIMVIGSGSVIIHSHKS